jgi:hypothetical protein
LGRTFDRSFDLFLASELPDQGHEDGLSGGWWMSGGKLLKIGLTEGCIRGKSGPKVDENPEDEKADYWTVKVGNPKHVKPMTQNHAKGGYHAPLSNAVYP